MGEPVVESVTEVRRHLATVIDRADREGIPTVITRRGKREGIVIGIQEFRRLRRAAGDAEEG